MTEEGFTIKDIVIEIRTDVRDLAGKIDRIDRQGSIGTREELVDHEKRLRGLERFRYYAAGAIAFAAGLGPVVGVYVSR